MFHIIKKKIRDATHSNKSFKKIYNLLNRIKVTVLSPLSDEVFAKIYYRENTGLKLDLTNPRTYNEKLWWLKINYRTPLMTICSDKYQVREYVEDCGLGDILPNNYGVFEDARDIDFNKLPDKAMIKCNHVSGINFLYSREKEFNKDKFIKNFNSALKKNYYLQSREWNYKNIPPRIVIDEFLEDNKSNQLIDYRFMCFQGKVKLILIDIETMAADGSHNPSARRNLYDRDFNKLDERIGRENFEDGFLKKPNNFELMIKYAEILSKPFPHCRVDLYNINGKIIFGEITFYPGGATQKISSERLDLLMGEWIEC